MKKALLSLFVFAMTVFSVKASHQVAGDIGYTCLGNNQYEFYIYFYRDCGGISAPTSMTLTGTSSCGTVSINLQAVDLSPNDPSTMGVYDTLGLCPSFQTTCNGGSYPGIEILKLVGTTTVAPCSDWEFCATTCCRNASPNFPPQTPSTTYNGSSMAYYCSMNNADGTCDDSPIWNKPPRAYICQDFQTFMDNGATDPDGDSLVFALVDALEGCGGGTVTYNQAPYNSVPFSATYPLTTVSGTFPFDPTTGYSTFTPLLLNPPLPGVPANGYNEVAVIAVEISSYRNNVLKGTTIRDMQVVTLQDCDPLNAQSNGVSQVGGGTAIDNDTIKVCAGDTLDFSVLVIDPVNQDDFVLQTNLEDLLPGLDFSYDTFQAINIVQGVFLYPTTIDDVGYYNFNVEAKNSGCPVSISKIFDFVLEIIPSTKAYITPDTTCYNSADSVIFEARGGSTFTWWKIDPEGGAPSPAGFTGGDNERKTYGFPPETAYYFVWSDLATFGCRDRDTVRMTVVPPVEILGDLEICLEDTAFLAESWDWKPSPNLVRTWNDDEEKNDSINLEFNSGTYWITLTDTADHTGYVANDNLDPSDAVVCTVSDTVEVAVVQCPVSIPNIFTPNGDGVNDVFFIDNIRGDVWNLTVYNRWGREVLVEVLDYQNDWDGGELNDGMYYYRLWNQNGAVLTEFKGWVQIAR